MAWHISPNFIHTNFYNTKKEAKSYQVLKTYNVFLFLWHLLTLRKPKTNCEFQGPMSNVLHNTQRKNYIKPLYDISIYYIPMAPAKFQISWLLWLAVRVLIKLIFQFFKITVNQFSSILHIKLIWRNLN